MLFFDDNVSNIKTVSKLGACCVRVSEDSGLTFAAVQSGLKKYREACSSRSSMMAWLNTVRPKSDPHGAGKDNLSYPRSNM